MKYRIVLVLCALVALSWNLTAQDEPAGEPSPAPKATATVKLSLVNSSAALGDDLQIEVTLTNAGATALDVPALELARTAVTLHFDSSGKSWKLERYVPDVRLENRAGVRTVSLPSGKSLTTVFDIPAVVPGESKIQATVANPAGGSWTSNAATFRAGPQTKLQADVKTSLGTMTFQLESLKAPATVTNFVMLCRSDFYSNLLFYRVVYDWLIQAGCPYDKGHGTAGYHIPPEINDLEQAFGTLGMSHQKDDSDTGGSIFYIVSNKSGIPALGATYTGFGTLLAGEEVLEDINDESVDSVTMKPNDDVSVMSITIYAKN